MILGKLSLKDIEKCYDKTIKNGKKNRDYKLFKCFTSERGKQFKKKVAEIVKSKFKTENFRIKVDWKNYKYIIYK
jgi:hypothetical protein